MGMEGKIVLIHARTEEVFGSPRSGVWCLVGYRKLAAWRDRPFFFKRSCFYPGLYTKLWIDRVNTGCHSYLSHLTYCVQGRIVSNFRRVELTEEKGCDSMRPLLWRSLPLQPECVDEFTYVATCWAGVLPAATLGGGRHYPALGSVRHCIQPASNVRIFAVIRHS